MANTKLAQGATQFIVTEAKLFSPLSPRVTNAAYFDQAARNVACMAEVLFKAGRRPQELSSLAFLVLAPSAQVRVNLFGNHISSASIRDKVFRRVSEYPTPELEAKIDWRQNWFLPTLEHMKIVCLSWEEVIHSIRTIDPNFGSNLAEFYAECFGFNRLQEPDLAVDSNRRGASDVTALKSPSLAI